MQRVKRNVAMMIAILVGLLMIAQAGISGATSKPNDSGEKCAITVDEMYSLE